MEHLQQTQKLFENPTAEFRSAPFWAWNDRMDPDEVQRQIQDMHRQGIGGFFIHSREGLETEYMGEEWFSCVQRAVETAKELGMKAWLYDEDRWPSGTAGGSIMKVGGDDSRYKGLTLQLCRTLPDSLEKVDAVYLVSAQGMECSDYRRLDTPQAYQGQTLPEGQYFMVLRTEICFKSAWFNDETPPDNLNPASVRRFIESTHEKYAARFQQEFGKTIPGIFTDEPGLADSHTHFQDDRAWLPWSYTFPEFFRERRGYDIFDTLPVIFFNGKGQQKARHDYWRTVTERYSESYTKQISQWCSEHGFAFTGHFLQEDKLGLGTKVSGAIMPHYRFAHVPGIDMLSERCVETITCKQCTSVANQYGRPRVLTETYGCAGWEFTFEGQKWMGDWQFVHGVNIRCQHLDLYSIKGCRKRDYPPVFNYQTSWWEKNKVIDDYFARISVAMTGGDAVRDLLVLHPASTAWSRLGCNPYGVPNRSNDRDLPAINQYGNEFNDFIAYLSGSHYDYDLGDEIILSEIASIQEKTLQVGRISYQVVVLPPIDTMLRSTYELLRRFLENGGRMIAVAPLPSCIEGVEDSAVASLFSHPNMTVVNAPEKVCPVLETMLPRRVSLRGKDGREITKLLYLLKDCSDHYALFVINNDREQGYDVTLDAAICGKITQLDPITGKAYPRGSRQKDRMVLSEYFAPADSKLYLIQKNTVPDIDTACLPQIHAIAANCVSAAAPRYRYTLSHPNALTLDRCRWRFASGEWSEPMDVWKAQSALRDALGMRQIYENGITQRYQWIGIPHPKDGTPVEFAFTFQVEQLPQSPCHLVVEKAADYHYTLNGKPVSNQPDGWYLDHDFGTILLPELCLGENTLVISCGYENRMEFEDCYLIGNFGVNTSRSITTLPDTLITGDWGLQGLLHYSGSVTYHMTLPVGETAGKRSFLHPEKYSGVLLSVTVNGQPAGELFTASQQYLEITQWLHDGDNEVDITVVGSPRNLLGPFHRRTGKEATTGPNSFRTTGIQYSPEYDLYPYGLMGLVKLHQISYN